MDDDRIMFVGRAVAPHSGYDIDPFSEAALERCLPVIGPTAMLLGQGILRWTHGVTPGYAVGFDVDTVAAALGVKPTVVRQSLERLNRFRLAQHQAAGLMVFESWSSFTTHARAGARVVVAA